MRKTFSRDVRESVRQAQHCYCKRCLNPIHDFHHVYPNTKTGNKLYPLFLHSPFNCVGLCRQCHDNHKHEYIINDDHAMMYEAWLKEQMYEKMCIPL